MWDYLPYYELKADKVKYKRLLQAFIEKPEKSEFLDQCYKNMAKTNDMVNKVYLAW